MLEKIIKDYEQTYGVHVGCIIKYGDEYFVKDTQYDSSLLIIYDANGNEVGFVNTYDDAGMEIMYNGKILLNNY